LAIHFIEEGDLLGQRRPLEDDDIIQWWGVSSNVDRMAGRKNPVILANYDLAYLDIGYEISTAITTGYSSTGARCTPFNRGLKMSI
jgi:hypothetical protein